MAPFNTPLCQFCGHVLHEPKKCTGHKCKCKCKPGFWSTLGSNLGNAIGEALFGGNR